MATCRAVAVYQEQPKCAQHHRTKQAQPHAPIGDLDVGEDAGDGKTSPAGFTGSGPRHRLVLQYL